MVINHSKWKVNASDLALSVPCVISFMHVTKLALYMAAPDIGTHIREHWEVCCRGDNIVHFIVHRTWKSLTQLK